MNRSPASSSSRRLLADSIPASATTTMSVDAVPGLERLDDRQDRGGLGLVALEAADLQREPAPVDQQPDHDLRVDPAFLGVADLAQVVLLLGLEVQRRHVVQAPATRPRWWRRARSTPPRSCRGSRAPGQRRQRAEHRAQRRRAPTRARPGPAASRPCWSAPRSGPAPAARTRHRPTASNPSRAYTLGQHLPQQRGPLAGDHPTPDRACRQRYRSSTPCPGCIRARATSISTASSPSYGPSRRAQSRRRGPRPAPRSAPSWPPSGPEPSARTPRPPTLPAAGCVNRPSATPLTSTNTKHESGITPQVARVRIKALNETF